jgi:pilus assembly protein CpaE
MVALNTAYAVSTSAPGSTVLIDMDYQFGMIAKQIDLQAAFGIRELFDNPDRSVDATLLRRMVAKYGTLDVISAPADLRFLPNLDATTMRNLIAVLRENYDTIIIDLPHVWLPWVATVVQEADKVVLVAQLWLKSVAHAARIMKVWRDMGISAQKLSVVINRAGAKFKEAVEESDFERVCASSIHHRLPNDIRTIGAAEAEAKTVMELPPSDLSQGLDYLARILVGLTSAEDMPRSTGAPSLISMFKKRG